MWKIRQWLHFLWVIILHNCTQWKKKYNFFKTFSLQVYIKPNSIFLSWWNKSILNLKYYIEVQFVFKWYNDFFSFNVNAHNCMMDLIHSTPFFHPYWILIKCYKKFIEWWTYGKWKFLLRLLLHGQHAFVIWTFFMFMVIGKEIFGNMS
jgi:hypothetical protein